MRYVKGEEISPLFALGEPGALLEVLHAAHLQCVFLVLHMVLEFFRLEVSNLFLVVFL